MGHPAKRRISLHWHRPYDKNSRIINEIDSPYIIAYGNDTAHDDDYGRAVIARSPEHVEGRRRDLLLMDLGDMP
jgi:hypothetical protein